MKVAFLSVSQSPLVRSGLLLLLTALLVIPFGPSAADPIPVTYTFAVALPGNSEDSIQFTEQGITVEATAQDDGEDEEVRWKTTGLGVKGGDDNDQVNRDQTLILTFLDSAVTATLRTVELRLLDNSDGVTITVDNGTGGTHTINPLTATSGDPGNDEGEMSRRHDEKPFDEKGLVPKVPILENVVEGKQSN